jgi:hypothetical protein
MVHVLDSACAVCVCVLYNVLMVYGICTLQCVPKMMYQKGVSKMAENGVPYMVHHRWCTIHGVPWMAYHRWRTVHGVPYGTQGLSSTNHSWVDNADHPEQLNGARRLPPSPSTSCCSECCPQWTASPPSQLTYASNSPPIPPLPPSAWTAPSPSSQCLNTPQTHTEDLIYRLPCCGSRTQP